MDGRCCRRSFASVLVAAFVLSIASAQGASQHSIPGNAREILCDDFTFKFLIVGQMAQVIEGDKIVGTIITRNGDLDILPVWTGPAADRLRKTFGDWWAATKELLGPGAANKLGRAAVPAQCSASGRQAASAQAARAQGTPSPQKITIDDVSRALNENPFPAAARAKVVGDLNEIKASIKTSLDVNTFKTLAGRFADDMATLTESVRDALNRTMPAQTDVNKSGPPGTIDLNAHTQEGLVALREVAGKPIAVYDAAQRQMRTVDHGQLTDAFQSAISRAINTARPDIDVLGQGQRQVPLAQNHPAERHGSPAERAYQVLQEEVGQDAASTLRALQLLGAESPSNSREKRCDDATGPYPGQMVDEVMLLGCKSSDNAIDLTRAQSIAGEVEMLLEQLSRSQGTPQGAAAVVDVLAALAGDKGVADLRAAGDLSVIVRASVNAPHAVAVSAAREALRKDIDAAVNITAVGQPLEAPPHDPKPWRPGASHQGRSLTFAEALRVMQERFDHDAAATFVSWESIERESVQTGRIGNIRNATEISLGTLFGTQMVVDLLKLKSEGRSAEAETALRAFVGTGGDQAVDLLRKSGTFDDTKQPKAHDLRPLVYPRIRLSELMQETAAAIINNVETVK